MPFILANMFGLTLIVVCGYAVVRGGRPERIGAGTSLLASLATAGVRLLFPSAWLPAAISVLAIDLVVIGIFFWLATTTIRFWPIWATGFALSNLLVSLAGALFPRIQLFAFHTGLGIYAYLVLGAVTVGIWWLPRDADPVVRNGSRRLFLDRKNGSPGK